MCFEPERGFEQRIVLQIDLPDRKIIRRAPIGVHFVEEIGRQWIRHGQLQHSGMFRPRVNFAQRLALFITRKSVDRLMWSNHDPIFNKPCQPRRMHSSRIVVLQVGRQPITNDIVARQGRLEQRSPAHPEISWARAQARLYPANVQTRKLSRSSSSHRALLVGTLSSAASRVT